MKPRYIIGAIIIVGLALGVWWILNPSNLTSEVSIDLDYSFQDLAVVDNAKKGSQSLEPSRTAGSPPPPLLGETILEGYANTNMPLENDLLLVSRLMDSSLLLLKTAANRPLSANEDWADLWRGVNDAQERFLPDDHVALNARGQLIDRWQTPLFFHTEGDRRWSIRSAGPDGEMWTGDDIHRNADGSHRRGEELNPKSLF